MAGLDPAIHVPATWWSVRKGVDHRVKPVMTTQSETLHPTAAISTR
jgi:hypothetical protein